MSNILNDADRYIAYICPYCSEVSKKNVNIFKFSATTPLRLTCSDIGCREECVLISRTKDKFKIVLECPVCGEAHTFKVSSKSFLFKSILTFSCPECNIAVFYIGKRSEVEKSLSENCDKISEFAEQFSLIADDFDVLYNTIDRLQLLIENGKISCSCGGCDIIPDMSEGAIVLSCYDCGKSIVIEPNEESLKFLEASDGFTI